jgi:LuxR family transcriptional regulator, maltose regulon positive regulatory protein
MVGQYREALNDAEEALSLFVNTDKTNLVYADSLSSKGSVLYSLGNINEALELYREALSVYQKLGDVDTAAKVWLEVGRVYRTLAQYKEAEEAYLKSLEHYQATGNLNWQANLYNNLGVLQHDQNEYTEATSSLEKAIHYARLGGSVRLEAYALTSIGDLYQELDALQETLEAYRQARIIAMKLQEGYLLFYLYLMEARLKLVLGDIDSAEELLKTAQIMAEDRGSRLEQNICCLERGRLKLSRGQYLDAIVDFSASLTFFIQEDYQLEVPRARLYVLLVSFLLGRQEEAMAQAALLRPMIEQDEQFKLLIAAGREIKEYLRKLSQAFEGFPAMLLAHIEQHEQGIPALRRLIRRQAVIVPFAPPKLTIRALGKIQVKISDHLVTSSDWQVQTARDLFFLLLAHPEGLTKEEIGEIFWPDSSPSELKLRFKNTIYRLRHAAGKDVILFQGESQYLFNRSIDYEYDLESFLKEITQAGKAENREKKIAHYENAVRFYRGPFLPEVDEEWVIVERERLFQLQVDALLELAILHMENRDYSTALAFCQRALKEDSCQEDAHRIAMRVYAAMGNRALIMRQFEQCRQALLDEVNAPPSYQTQTLYKSLIQ